MTCFYRIPLLILENNDSISTDQLKELANTLGKIDPLHPLNIILTKYRASQEYFKKIHVDKECDIVRVSNMVDENGEALGLQGNRLINWHTDAATKSPDAGYYGSVLYNKKNGGKAIASFCHTPDLIPLISGDDYEIFKQSKGYHSYEYGDGGPQSPWPLIMNTIRDKESFYLNPSSLKRTDCEYPSKYIKMIDSNLEHYHHHWKSNDILIYDNTSLLHKKQTFTGDRVLYKTFFVFTG